MPNPLQDKIICIDPGHGGTADKDDFRVGPSGEREEWVNLRVSDYLNKMLVEKGARPVMTRTEDVFVELAERAHIAMEMRADAFISVHHNATADRAINFPIIYFHGMKSQNKAGAELGRICGDHLRKVLFDGMGPLTVCSDHTIFPTRGASVLRGTYGIPAIIGEASFFSNAEEEQRLKLSQYNLREAQAYVAALEEFFKTDVPEIKPKDTDAFPPPFRAFEQADRMKSEALSWRENFERGKELASSEDEEKLQEAYDLLSLSARSFPDSPIAKECHQLRAQLLMKLGKEEEAKQEKLRADEFYLDAGA